MSGDKAKSTARKFLGFTGKSILVLFIGLVMAFFIAGSNLPIKCMVIDADTGKPIEGAIVMVGWSRTVNVIGFATTKTVKLAEVVSDKNGSVTVPGIISYAVDPPYITVYKKGYVAWSNEYIFPSWEKRRDFKWKNGYVFRLEKFKSEYPHEMHTSFIHTATHEDYVHSKLIYEAIRWEETKTWEEIRQKRKANK